MRITDNGKVEFEDFGAFPGLDTLINTGHKTESDASLPLVGGMIKLDLESGCRRYPSGLLPETRDALDRLSDDELAEIQIFRCVYTNEFVGVGFIGPAGLFCRWADLRRANVLMQLEKQIKYEEEIRSKRR